MNHFNRTRGGGQSSPGRPAESSANYDHTQTTAPNFMVLGKGEGAFQAAASRNTCTQEILLI